MRRLITFLRIALAHVRRGGQRIVVALLCVAFGVMSLVAMTMLSSALERMLVDAPQDLIGADISMSRDAEDAVTPEHVAGLEDLRRAGVIEKYTQVAYSASLTFHLRGSGELHFPSAGIGIEPAAYPLIGALTVESPAGAGLPTLLAEVGDVLVSRDLALEYGLTPGEELVLSDLDAGSAPLPARIRGIVNDTPNHKGSKLYYSLATAARLAGNQPSINTVLATAADPAAAQLRLRALGWQAYLAVDLAANEARIQELFSSLINGAGVLGLLVGGVGIANTMQVLMRRRQREVAVWKSMGYRNIDLLILFALEAGLLGLAGSLLGAGLGVIVSAGLVDLFSRTSTMLVQWSLTPEPVLVAILVGVITTIAFALWPIVATSRIPPVALLRGEATSAAQLPRLQALALLLLLALPFTAAITLVMGSLLKAIGVLAVAASGLAGLGGALGFAWWLVIHLLPMRRVPLLNLSRGSLQGSRLGPIFALIALFVGVTTLALSGVIAENAKRVMDRVELDTQDYNLTILAPADQAEQVAAALERQPVEKLTTGYATRVREVHLLPGMEDPAAPLLIARSDDLGEYTVAGAPWGSQSDGVYLTEMAFIPDGSTLQVTLWDGSTRELPVAGTYQVYLEQLFRPELGVLLPVELSRAIAPPDQAQYQVRVPAGRLAGAARELGAALPGATVIDLVAYAARFTAQYRDFYVFAISMAGLALLAGILLMANSVSLAVLDRRYEIGVLKAMGYTRRHIQTILMVEFALIALVATAAGLIVVKGYLWLAGMNNEVTARLLVLTPQAAGGVALLTLGLTAFTILAVTWKPTRISPLVVLNDRE